MDDSSPEYDQDFFLKLIRPADGSLAARRAARRRWREWRSDSANKDVAVMFAGVDFRTDENRCISFSGLEFGDKADFREAKFGDKARFVRAKFGDEAQFVSVVFGDGARFKAATFGDDAQFQSATFGNWAQFQSATFGNWAEFQSATFGNWAQFQSATFGNWAEFQSATFGNGARFHSATFGDRAQFQSATFGDRAQFQSATFGNWASFRATLLQGNANFAGESIEVWIEKECERLGGKDAEGSPQEKAERVEAFRKRQKIEGFGPHRFLEIDFSDACIRGEISFARRAFEGLADFTGVRFHQPPNFDGASELQRLDLTGARVSFVGPDTTQFRPHWTEWSSVPIRLRAFRAIAESTKNHDLERDLYIEERKAERGVYWRRYLDALDAGPALKAARVMLRSRPIWPRLNPFAPAETPARKQARLSHGRSRHVRPAMRAWSSPARLRLRRRFRARAMALAHNLARFAIHAAWIAVMGVYWALSDYGRSLARPLVALAITLPLFIWAFDASLATKRAEASAAAALHVARTHPSFGDAAPAPDDAAQKVADAKAKHLAATRQLAISNTIPFVGPLTIDGEVKKFLLCGVAPEDADALKKCVPVAPLAYQFVLIGQNILSALLLFFFGLALRNYFKVK